MSALNARMANVDRHLAPRPDRGPTERNHLLAAMVSSAIASACSPVLPYRELEQDYARLGGSSMAASGFAPPTPRALRASMAANDFRCSVMKLLVGLRGHGRRRPWPVVAGRRRRRAQRGSEPGGPAAGEPCPPGRVQDNGDDLVRRAIVDSDSAATDILVARLRWSDSRSTGADRLGVRVRFDRDERRLQTETAGLTWRPEFVDSAGIGPRLRGDSGNDA